ncbi:MAG TPA: hypothetical protein VN457_04950 [Chlamydiales bacterium]|nr:hypothetical protein [Chlamydiales bacterium]
MDPHFDTVLPGQTQQDMTVQGPAVTKLKVSTTPPSIEPLHIPFLVGEVTHDVTPGSVSKTAERGAQVASDLIVTRRQSTDLPKATLTAAPSQTKTAKAVSAKVALITNAAAQIKKGMALADEGIGALAGVKGAHAPGSVHTVSKLSPATVASQSNLERFATWAKNFFTWIGLSSEENSLFKILSDPKMSPAEIAKELKSTENLHDLGTLFSHKFEMVKYYLGKEKALEILNQLCIQMKDDDSGYVNDLLERALNTEMGEISSTIKSPMLQQLARKYIDAKKEQNESGAGLNPKFFLEATTNPVLRHLLSKSTTRVDTELKFCMRYATFKNAVENEKDESRQKKLLEQFVTDLQKQDDITLSTSDLNIASEVYEDWKKNKDSNPKLAIATIDEMFNGISNSVKDNYRGNRETRYNIT